MSTVPNFTQARAYLDAAAPADAPRTWVALVDLVVAAHADFPDTPGHVLQAALLTEYRAMSDYGIATVAGTLVRLDTTPEGTPAP